MYAATSNGVVKIGHGKTKKLSSRLAVKNSYTLFKENTADAVMLSSLFHYRIFQEMNFLNSSLPVFFGKEKCNTTSKRKNRKLDKAKNRATMKWVR